MEMMDTQREGDNGDKIVDDEATTTTSTSTATESLLITQTIYRVYSIRSWQVGYCM